jgi:hypothetical protein
MSNNKKACENYLFEDYPLKACIRGEFSEFAITAYYKEVKRDMVISIC